MKSVASGLLLAITLSLGLFTPVQAQGLKLDEQLTLSPTRGEKPSHQKVELFSLFNRVVPLGASIDEPSSSSSSNAMPVTPEVSLSLANPARLGNRKNREIKALGLNPKVVSMALTNDSTLSVSQAKIGDRVSSQTLQGIHFVSKINKDRSIFFGVETFESNADASRANVGVLFSLD